MATFVVIVLVVLALNVLILLGLLIHYVREQSGLGEGGEGGEFMDPPDAIEEDHGFPGRHTRWATR